jgi:hypothetical protein
LRLRQHNLLEVLRRRHNGDLFEVILRHSPGDHRSTVEKHFRNSLGCQTFKFSCFSIVNYFTQYATVLHSASMLRAGCKLRIGNSKKLRDLSQHVASVLFLARPAALQLTVCTRVPTRKEGLLNAHAHSRALRHTCDKARCDMHGAAD